MRYAIIVAVVVLCGKMAFAASLNVRDADRLTILPSPKDLKLSGKTVSLAGWEIVLSPKPPSRWPDVCHDFVRLEVAAEEINDRLKKLGAEPLPVVNRPGGKKMILISVNPRLRGVRGKEQGYIIRMTRDRIRLTGVDPLGALYAAVTLRKMIVKQNGTVVLLDGTVRDWPDFKYRRCGQLSHPFGRWCPELTPDRDRWEEVAEAYLAAQRPSIDHLFRLKINGVDLRKFRVPGWEKHSKEPWYRPARVVALKKVTQYCHDRGILCGVILGTEIGSYLTPEEKADASSRRPGTAYTWARKHAHRRRAADLARRIAEVGVDYTCLHPYDGGAYSDPETWSKRRKADRAMYGDDERWKASGEQFMLYYEAFRKERPSIKFETVTYPYFAHFTDPDFWHKWHDLEMPYPCGGWALGRGIENQEQSNAMQARLTRYHTKCGDLLDDAIYAGWRESSRETIRAAQKLYRNQPQNIWFYAARSNGWRSYFEPQIRFAKTFLFKGRRDAIYVRPVSEIAVPVTAEYVWNATVVPDGSDKFDTFRILYETEGKNVTPYQKKHLIPRSCRLLFGSLGPAFEDICARNLSLNYVTDPVQTARGKSRENWDNHWKYIEEQAARFAELRPKLLQALADVDAGNISYEEGDFRESWTYPYFMTYVKAFVTGSYVAELQAVCYRAETEMKQGNTAAAAKRLRSALDRLPEIEKQVGAILKRFKSDRKRLNWVTNTPRKELDIGAWRKRIESLLRSSGNAYAPGSIPDFLAPVVAERKLEVPRASGPITVDGKVDETAWRDALEVDYFGTKGGKELAKFDTLARLLWDGEALYIHFTAYDSSKELRRESTTRDAAGFFGDDLFELMLDTNLDRKSYVQLAVNANGTRWDGSVGNGDLDPAWEAAVHIPADDRVVSWQAEVKIPFAALRIGVPKPGDKWGVTLSRFRAGKVESPESEWSGIIMNPSNHSPQDFRTLVFSDAPASNREPATTIGLVEARLKQTGGDDMTMYAVPDIAAVRSLHGVTVTVTARLAGEGDVLGSAGKEVLRIPGRWRPTEPVVVPIDRTVGTDVEATVSVEAKHGAVSAGGKAAEAGFVVSPSGEVKRL